jgi:uncharacterized protein YeaO (DUF488 family)
MVRIKRIYEPPASTDGYRVLVDRLWPRGLKREAAAIDEWLKAIAPSSMLREWYGHRPELWLEFRVRYRLELAAEAAATELERLRIISTRRPLTLLTATRNETENHAVVLSEILTERP